MGRYYCRLEVMYYRLVFTKKSKLNNTLKLTLLICGVILDIAALMALILAILGSVIYLTMFFASIAFSILFRVFALKLVYDVECRLQGGKLIISKIYPNKTTIVLSENLCDISVVPIIEQDFEWANYSENVMQMQMEIKNKKHLCDNDLNNTLKSCIPTKNQPYIDLLSEEKEKYLIITEKICLLCNLDKYIYASILKCEEI